MSLISPRPGASSPVDLLGESLFFIRGEDGEIRGFYNVCRHRAHRLVEGSGFKTALVCPYHAWTYDLDGTLRHARITDKITSLKLSALYRPFQAYERLGASGLVC